MLVFRINIVRYNLSICTGRVQMELKILCLVHTEDYKEIMTKKRNLGL